MGGDGAAGRRKREICTRPSVPCNSSEWKARDASPTAHSLGLSSMEYLLRPRLLSMISQHIHRPGMCCLLASLSFAGGQFRSGVADFR